MGTAVIRGWRLDQEVKTNEKWLWLIATAIHCKLRMVLHTNYIKSSVGSGGGGSPLFLDQTEAWRAEKIFGDNYWKLWRSYWHFTSVYSSLSLWILRRIVTYMYKINHTSVWTIWILQSLWWMSVQQDSRVHNNLIILRFVVTSHVAIQAFPGTADLAAEIAYVALRGSLVKSIIFHWY